jgi:hypothetical protein
MFMMCGYDDWAMTIIAQWNARALDTGSEAEPQQISISHELATEYERNTLT